MSDIFTVLADPTRRALLSALAVKSQSVSDLVTLTGEGQPTVSKHLKTLREAGLVTVEAAGQARVYSIDRGPLAEFTAFLNEIAPGMSGAGAGASKAKSSAKPVSADPVEKTLTDAAVTLAGWLNEGAAWVSAKVQETVTENDLSTERLGKELGRKLADAKLQATDTAADAEAVLRAELGDLSSRLGIRAADLSTILDEAITEVKGKASDKLAEARNSMMGKRKAAQASTAEADSDL